METADFSSYDIIIDAILGTGVKSRLPNKISNLIDDINNSNACKVSIDVPSGLDPDNVNMVEKCVNSDLIITFHDMKKGLEKFQDKVVVVDIGLPKGN